MTTESAPAPARPDPGWAEPHPARAVVDLAAIRHNVRVLAASAPDAQLMAVVKADAYGHGLLPVARTALAAGATWLGTAQLTEALALRSGLAAEDRRPRILTWLYAPGAPLDAALEADIDLSAAAPWAVEQIAAAARRTGRTARVHLKVDTGMGRGGTRPERFGDLLDAAVRARAEGLVAPVGLWSHLARADEPEHPFTAEQLAVLDAAFAEAVRAGVHPEIRHIAQSAGTLFHPGAHLDLVRPGIALYGLSPAPAAATSAELGLRPAMRLEARVVLVKDVPAGTPVSYGGAAVTARETSLAVVPLGYSDGLSRTASDAGPVRLGGRDLRATGRICMDQTVIDLGGRDTGVREGDVAVIFGDGADGGPTAEDWAAVTGTISYEIVARLGARVPRVYVGASEDVAGVPGP